MVPFVNQGILKQKIYEVEKTSGEMVTHFQKPTDVYILNNSLGDVQVYNAKKNELCDQE